MWMHKGRRAFIASSNQRISKTEERLQSTECFSAVAKSFSDKIVHQDQVELCYQQTHFDKPIDNYQTLKAARTFYLYGYPVLCNYFSISELYKQFWRPEAIGCVLHRKNGSPDLLPESRESSMQSECWPASNLITFSEIEVLSTFNNHSPNLYNVEYLIDQFECNCSLCLSRMSAIKSVVLKAKCLIDEAVKNSCALAYPDMVAYSIKKANPTYLINLAHLILMLACLRGMI